MIGTLIGIVITLVIVGVLFWACQQLLALIPMAEPIATIVRVVMVVILVLIVLWVIMALLGMGGIRVNTLSLR